MFKIKTLIHEQEVELTYDTKPDIWFPCHGPTAALPIVTNEVAEHTLILRLKTKAQDSVDYWYFCAIWFPLAQGCWKLQQTGLNIIRDSAQIHHSQFTTTLDPKDPLLDSWKWL